MVIEFIEDKDVALAAATLTGDVRDALLGWVRTLQKPWAKMTEAEQKDVACSLASASDNLVVRAVKMLAAEGRRTLVAHVDKVTVKDDIQAVLKLSKADESRHELIDAQGQSVLIVVADPEPFKGERAPAQTDPDQHVISGLITYDGGNPV